MTWLVDAINPTPPGERMAALWQLPEILCAPGAHNAYAGIIAKRAGFKALYVPGGAVYSMMGFQILGTDLRGIVLLCPQHSRRKPPDSGGCDWGYGGLLNVVRLVHEMEDAGAAAIQIEDQILPKKCGHLNDKKLVSPREMAAKIAAARRARRRLRIMARTDALAQEGMDATIARAKLYLEAGADAIFPEAVNSAEMYKRFAGEIEAPLLANMTEFGRTPFFTAKEFESFGFKMVIWPATSFRATSKTLHEVYDTLAREGSIKSYLPRLSTRAEVYDVTQYTDYEKLDGSIALSVVPPPLVE
jgi:methylisocitrate lyase